MNPGIHGGWELRTLASGRARGGRHVDGAAGRDQLVRSLAVSPERGPRAMRDSDPANEDARRKATMQKDGLGPEQSEAFRPTFKSYVCDVARERQKAHRSSVNLLAAYRLIRAVGLLGVAATPVLAAAHVGAVVTAV